MEFVEQIAAVGAVLLLLVAALWWLRRNGSGLPLARRQAGRRLECLERLPLSPQHTLHLVRWGEQALLLASTPAGCALVESRPCHDIKTQPGGAK